MKRIDLIKHLKAHGCVFIREGSVHSIFFNPDTERVTSIPRHKEINTFTGKKICRDIGVPEIKRN